MAIVDERQIAGGMRKEARSSKETAEVNKIITFILMKTPKKKKKKRPGINEKKRAVVGMLSNKTKYRKCNVLSRMGTEKKGFYRRELSTEKKCRLLNSR